MIVNGKFICCVWYNLHYILNFWHVFNCCYAEAAEDLSFDAIQYEFFGKSVIEDELKDSQDEMDDAPFEGSQYETFPSSEKHKARSSSSDMHANLY